MNEWTNKFFFFFCAFPSYISGVHHFWVRFLRMWPFFFFNPTIKVVTFRLRGWCVLGVFFVAGIHTSRTWMSGSFESVRWNVCMHRLDLGLYSHPKEFWGNGVWTHVNSKGKIPSAENVPRGGSNPRRCGQRVQALPTELFRPPNKYIRCVAHDCHLAHMLETVHSAVRTVFNKINN